MKREGVSYMSQHVETKLAQINRSDEVTGTVSAPIYLSTAYRHRGIGESTGFDYVRTKNPTRQLVEDAIANLENGARGLAFSSGMAAIQTIMALFKSGDELIVSSDLYGGTYRLFENEWKKYGLTFHYDDFSNEDCLRSKITPNTKAVFVETPTNPLMQEADIEHIARMTKEHGLLLIVDNTFYTPVLQRPLELGADIVIHSATKYLGGHNDLLAGLVVVKDEQLGEEMFQHQNAIGSRPAAI